MKLAFVEEAIPNATVSENRTTFSVLSVPEQSIHQYHQHINLSLPDPVCERRPHYASDSQVTPAPAAGDRSARPCRYGDRGSSSGGRREAGAPSAPRDGS